MEMSGGIGQLASALSKAQKTMKGAAKDSTNPHFKSKYADLASVWDAARDALTANGLSVVQGASADDSKVTVTTLLLHDSGEWVKDSLTALARDAGPQSVGSCITYGRRYGLAAMVGIAPEDDDAESATRVTTPHAAGSIPPLPRVTGPSVPNGGETRASYPNNNRWQTTQETDALRKDSVVTAASQEIREADRGASSASTQTGSQQGTAGRVSGSSATSPGQPGPSRASIAASPIRQKSWTSTTSAASSASNSQKREGDRDEKSSTKSPNATSGAQPVTASDTTATELRDTINAGLMAGFANPAQARTPQAPAKKQPLTDSDIPF